MIYLPVFHKISNIQPSCIVPLRISFRFFQHRTISLLVVDLPWNTTNHPIPISFVCNDSILSSIYVIWWYLRIIDWKLEMVPVFHLLSHGILYIRFKFLTYQHLAGSFFLIVFWIYKLVLRVVFNNDVDTHL